MRDEAIEEISQCRHVRVQHRQGVEHGRVLGAAAGQGQLVGVEGLQDQQAARVQRLHQLAVHGGPQRGRQVQVDGDHGGIRLLAHTPTQLGQELTIEYEGQQRVIRLPLIGAYQTANALVAAGLVIATGGDPSMTFDAVSRLQPVRGRLERAAITPSGTPVYIDYAHTPDALEAAIEALRPHVSGRLFCVFGAGGDRDHGKRAPMGAAASRHADVVIVTDDNPRGEDAGDIRREVLSGAGDNAIEIGDRREAIAHAIGQAEKDDIVLVAGKGHEEGQIIGSGADMRVLPFNDVEVARECASQRARQGE